MSCKTRSCRRSSREGYVGGWQAGVDECREYIEPAKSVCEDMVRHDHHRSFTIDKITNQTDQSGASLGNGVMTTESAVSSSPR